MTQDDIDIIASEHIFQICIRDMMPSWEGIQLSIEGITEAITEACESLGAPLIGVYPIGDTWTYRGESRDILYNVSFRRGEKKVDKFQIYSALKPKLSPAHQILWISDLDERGKV